MVGGPVRHARAFAPSHVSGLFVPRLGARDPRGRGSVGAGLVLDVGVTASVAWVPGARTSLELTADVPGPLEISEEVARRLSAREGGRLQVSLRHTLPIGQGFGSSAAGALATGLAVADALRLARREAVATAHLSDLFGGGGLGGVAAILGGGLELRLRPGIPPFGRVARERVERRVLVGIAGPPIRSPSQLRDPERLRRFERGIELFDLLVADPGWEAFWDAAERFTDEMRLDPPPLRAIVHGLRRRGARAAQAMFGGSFFAALPEGPRGAAARRWLLGRGVHGLDVEVARRGARLLPGASATP